MLDALPALRSVASRSTGVNHIDLERCRERGITVCNVPSYGSNTVAEHVFGLLLMISHRLEEAVQRGFAPGNDMQDWLGAERELASREAEQ